ncbi:ABC-type spermidine/putrescine transport system permease subunit II [Devosia sp. UYZn731]|uniref:ABC transporter permease n=1 Tax=Devosia sp. UYZn731 TaxID=3156345 RepID=UPI00339A2975
MKREFHFVDHLTGLTALAALIVIYAPLAVVWVFSNWQPVRVRGKLGLSAFSWDSYTKLTQNQDILNALGTTFLVGFIATVLAVVLATIFALYYLRTRGWMRQLMQALILLPFLLPPIIVGLSLLIAFRELDLTRGLPTIIVGHVILVVPVVYRIVLNRLVSLSPSLTEASLDLGASQSQTFFFILLPQLRTAFVAGGLLAFAISFDETMVTLFLSGSTNTLPIRLWAMMRLGFVPEINALATLVVGVAAICTIIFGVMQLRSTVARH